MAALRRKKKQPATLSETTGGITILSATPETDLVICTRQVIQPGGFVLQGTRVHRNHPAVRAYPKHFRPLDEGGSP